MNMINVKIMMNKYVNSENLTDLHGCLLMIILIAQKNFGDVTRSL